MIAWIKRWGPHGWNVWDWVIAVGIVAAVAAVGGAR